MASAAVTRRRAHSSERPAEERDQEGKRPRPVSLVRTMSTSVDAALAGEIFDHFCNAGTLKSILRSYRYLCEVLRLKPNQLPYFYPKLKAKLKTWKAQALWTKLDKRCAQKCYNRGKACQGTRVMVIGAGPCGLRTALEAQLLGAKVVVVEKRDRYSRNNVLHLWPCNIQELRAMGAKKFYGKFCAGSIDHVSIRQLQCILLKVCLLLGVEVFEGVGFEDLVEPEGIETGWKARVEPKEHPVSQYEFDVLIGADGKRNTLTGFKRKEFRGKLAIAITANFINKHTEAEGHVEEISGVAFIFNQKFFNDLNDELGITLENVVYYKDETHYFVMTAKKQSLLNKGVLITNQQDPTALLAPENISQEALFQYAREAADFATKGQLPHLDFAVNHYGKPDVAMFDFTSMYAADHSARVTERHGHRLLQCLVGDSLLEPFWPTGTGCPRGFFSAMDAMWLMRQMESGKMTVLECLAERESIYRILSQTTPENINKDFANHSLDPSTRYGQLNLRLVLPFQVTQLYDTDNPAHLQPQNVLQDSAPKKRRRKESHVNPGTLLTWLQKQVENYELTISDMTTSFQNGLALCAIIHRYRPDLIDFTALDPSDLTLNNQLAFDILECELGVPPMTTGQEVASNAEAGRPPDKLAMISYLTQIYELFRKEIPYTLQQEAEQECDDLDDSVYYHNHKEGREKKEHRKNRKKDGAKSIGQLVASDAKKKKRSMESELGEEEAVVDKYKECRVSNKKRLAKLMERAALQELKRQERGVETEPKNIKNEERYKIIEQQFMGGGKRRTSGGNAKKSTSDLKRPIGRIDSGDWNVRQIEEKLRESRKTSSGNGNVEKVPKWSKEAFNDKLAKVKSNLEDVEQSGKQNDIDASLAKLQKKLREGSALETGERGANKVSALVEGLSSKLQPASKPQPELRREGSTVWAPPTKPPGSGRSDDCLFCAKKVYVVERMSAEGKFFHRSCFRCDYCNILLRLGSYVYHREGRFAGKFFCIPHSTATALEKYRFKKKTDEIQETEQKRKDARDSAVTKVERRAKHSAISPSNRDRLLEPKRMPLDRGATPERMTYEATLDMSEESGLEQIDEDEWTDRNFGNSTANDVNTSDDSISDLESDDEARIKAGVANASGGPLTVGETRRLAREWRARYKGGPSEGSASDCETGVGGERREVRYTDQEYEDDSSDCEDVLLEVPSLPGGRPARRRRSSAHSLSSDDLSSDYTTSDDSSSSEDSELLALVDGGCKKNPFTVPKITIQPNSPVPGKPAGSGGATPRAPLSPEDSSDPNYISQAIPLGPTPFGTALYQPSLSSLTKYQYKTPSLPNSSAQPTTQYRTLSGVLSNNLKKNWAAGPEANSDQPKRKVDQNEIDARLKSLMDRLSSQQSLLKPADKPSEEMQHQMKTMQPMPERKLSAPQPSKPYKPTVLSSPSKPYKASVLPSAASIRKQNDDKLKGLDEGAEISVEENGVSIKVPETVPKAEEKEESASGDSESDSSESESVTTEVSDCEHNNIEHVLPEIKINLAEAEESEPNSPTEKESETNKCDKPFGHELDFIDGDDESDKSESDKTTDNIATTQVVSEEKKRSPAKRRPSLLKTVVSIKSDQPVTVVNYTETFDTSEPATASTAPEMSSPQVELPSVSNQDMDDSFKTTEGLDSSKDVFESFNTTMDESVSFADASLESTGETSTETECLNSAVLVDAKDVVRMQESVTTSSGESDSGHFIKAQREENKNIGNLNGTQNSVEEKDECGNLLIVSENALPQQPGEHETSTDAVEHVETITEPVEPKDSLNDIYKVTNANEKIDRLANHQQHNSNMIHDLIIGRSKQRRVRQPRTTAPVSLVPTIPPKAGEVVASPMPEDEEPHTPVRDKSLSRGFRESSLSRSIREGSVGRSIREGSPKITLPPTPITNPEKFGIKVTEKRKDFKGSLSSLISPTESSGSQDITENMDGIISPDNSVPASPAKSGRDSTLSNNSNGKVKGKGFLSTVAGIFRTSSTSPSPAASPSHQAKPVREESTLLSRFSRKDGAKKRDEGVQLLASRTASLALQASHPSTPPVPLSRRIKLGSQPPQASEDSFSDDDEDEKSLTEVKVQEVEEKSSSGLPRHNLDRLQERKTKEGKKAARQARSNRARKAQEIQRELEVLEVECQDVEERGVELEQQLQDEESGEPMAAWYRLLGQKNKLVRREQELMVGSKQLELEDQAERLEDQLGRRLGQGEGEVLEQLLQNAEQRELLSAMLARDKERYQREDRDLQEKMAEQGIRFATPSSTES